MSTEQNLQTPKKCFACGEARRKAELVMYVPRLETYCKDITKCGNPKKHVVNQMLAAPHLPEHSTKLVPCNYESVSAEAKKYFGENSLTWAYLETLLGKPSSVRYETNQVLYLTKLMQDRGYSTVREALYDVIKDHMNSNKRLMNKEFLERKDTVK